MAWCSTNTNGGYPDHGPHPLITDNRGVEDHNPFRAFWNSPRDWAQKGYGFTPEARGVIDRDTSPPSRDHYKGKCNNLNNSDNYVDDDVVCQEGVLYFKPNKGGAIKSFYPKGEDNDNEKHKGKGYSPSYTIPSSSLYDSYKGNGNYAPSSFVPPSTQPKKETYYKSSYHNDDEKNKGNGHYAPSSPVSRPRKDTYYESVYPENNEKHNGDACFAPSSHVPHPRKDTYYESSYPDNDYKHKENDHYAPQPRHYYEPSNNTPIVTNPQPIKTRNDHKVTGYENTKSHSGSTVSPRNKGYEEIIDSTEARRRYAKASPRAEEKYTGTIDSKEAARKYNGVFVPF